MIHDGFRAGQMAPEHEVVAAPDAVTVPMGPKGALQRS